MNKRMEEVEEANVQVVPESFIQESLKGGAIENISRLNMASWGSDVSISSICNVFVHLIDVCSTKV